MNTPKTDSVAFDVSWDELDLHHKGAYVDSDFARKLETKLRIALTWMETYKEFNQVSDNGPLAQDIARIKELLKP